MHRASVNHVFRLKWSDRTGGLVPVAERAAARGKRSSRVFGALTSLALVGQAYAGGSPAAAPSVAGLPTGGIVTAGSGTISQTGTVLTVNQTSNKLITQWSSFNIAPGDVVKYVQPSKNAIALNRVLGSDPSVIQGALIANGQVFLINPNGILFSRTAQVNVRGLVASTLNVTDADFLHGNYQFSAAKAGSVTNLGDINASDGGVVALIAAKVENAGTIRADRGAVLLGAGDQVLLDLGAPVKLRISKGALDALVDNGGALRADGGTVLLTARAANELMTTVINNAGTVEARTLATGEKGQILLLGGMENDGIAVGGTLDASASNGGDGGHIETSAARVETLGGLSINAGAAAGKGGSWLVDPYDYTINSTAATNIVSALNQGTNVTVTTQSSNTSYGGSATTGSGNITVSSPITKTSGGAATLTLRADSNISVNSAITSTSGALGITLSAANATSATTGLVSVAANLNSNGGQILIGGAGGSTSHGIGYALTTATSPAVSIGTGVSVQSGGGNVTINGSSSAPSNSYSGTAAGVYILSGATIDTGGGNLFMSGISTGAAKEFGFAVEANSNTVTSFTTSGSSGAIVLDAQNTVNVNGALGLVSNGNQARVQFTAPSVAQIQVSLNGSLQNTTFGYNPPCNTGFPNCGTMTIPGSNGSYLAADYNVVSMATYALYVETGNGSKTYDGSTSATGLTLTTLGAPTDFSTSGLTFTTPSKNAGTHTSLVNGAGDPTSFTSAAAGTSGRIYAVGYDYGTYTINPLALTVTAGNKPYDGTAVASLTASGVVSGDNVTFSASGGFSSANVGSGIAVNVSGITLSGTDAGNYTTGSSSLSTAANITPRVVSLTGSRVYDDATDAGASIFTPGNLVAGQSLTLTGAGSFADKNVGSGKTVSLGTLALSNGSNGSASNYTLVGGAATASITP
ncbi:MAG TPA: filamentous hemagglutinin N-terminal domain-containing protein, partial [Steroidobacteraceae bacterium]